VGAVSMTGEDTHQKNFVSHMFKYAAFNIKILY